MSKTGDLATTLTINVKSRHVLLSLETNILSLSQCGEMERLHLHIQQLQLELVDAREKTGSNMDGSNISHKSLIEASKLEQSNDGQQDVNIRGSQGTNIGSIQNGNIECVSDGNTSTQVLFPSNLFCSLWFTCVHSFLEIILC